MSEEILYSFDIIKASKIEEI